MTLTAMRQALKDALGEIDNAGVQVAVSSSAYSPQATPQFLVRVLVGPPSEEAEERLDELLAPLGEDSVKEALESRTAADLSTYVAKHSGYRVYPVSAHEQALGAEWDVTVLV